MDRSSAVHVKSFGELYLARPTSLIFTDNMGWDALGHVCRDLTTPIHRFQRSMFVDIGLRLSANVRSLFIDSKQNLPISLNGGCVYAFPRHQVFQGSASSI